MRADIHENFITVYLKSSANLSKCIELLEKAEDLKGWEIAEMDGTAINVYPPFLDAKNVESIKKRIQAVLGKEIKSSVYLKNKNG